MAKLIIAVKNSIEKLGDFEYMVSVSAFNVAQGSDLLNEGIFPSPYFMTDKLMNLRSVIKALQDITDKSYNVEVLVDNADIVNCMKQGWYKKWEYSGWKTIRGTEVEYQDYWKQLLDEVKQFPKVTFVRPTEKHSTYGLAEIVHQRKLKSLAHLD